MPELGSKYVQQQGVLMCHLPAVCDLGQSTCNP